MYLIEFLHPDFVISIDHTKTVITCRTHISEALFEREIDYSVPVVQVVRNNKIFAIWTTKETSVAHGKSMSLSIPFEASKQDVQRFVEDLLQLLDRGCRISSSTDGVLQLICNETMSTEHTLEQQ